MDRRPTTVRVSALAALMLGAAFVGAPLVGYAAGWAAPLAGPLRVVRGFAPPAQRWAAGHRGVDLAGSPRQAVRAAGAGVVGYAGLLAGVPVVTVVHGGLRTTYQPVQATVQVGQAVTTGQVIGRLVASGSHCQPAACLHWGLLRGPAYLDPLSLLQRGPPRLLPLSGAMQAAANASASRLCLGCQPARGVRERSAGGIAGMASDALSALRF